LIRQTLAAAVPVLLSVVLLSCGGSGSPQGAALIPNIAGAWEFQAASNGNTTSFTGVEVALKEGQTLINGVQQPNGQISAAGASQISVVSVDLANATVVFGGNCPVTGSGGNSLSGSLQSLGGPITFTYSENGNTFDVTASLSGDGKSITGTYTSSGACSDSGTITGTALPKLTGTYVGQFTLPDGASDSVTVTLSENSSSVLTANLLGSTSNFTLSGPVTGNAFSAQGTFQGQQVTYEGYFGVQVIDPVSQLPVTGIYFVNATNSAQPAYAGTLIPPST
jgi:hypothetical protein